MTKISPEKLKHKLIAIYEQYLNGEDVSKESEKIYRDYLTASPLLDKRTQEAVDVLSAFTNWGREIEKKTLLPKVSKDRIKKILEKLKKADREDKETK